MVYVISVQIKNNKEVSEMPGYDGTGPLGQGAMTGKGMEYCNDVQDDNLRNSGRPFWRAGRGMGFRNRYFAAGVPGWQRGYYYGRGQDASISEYIAKDEKEMLKNKLVSIQKRLNALNKNKDKDV